MESCGQQEKVASRSITGIILKIQNSFENRWFAIRYIVIYIIPNNQLYGLEPILKDKNLHELICHISYFNHYLQYSV